jgi:hypothetical protein
MGAYLSPRLSLSLTFPYQDAVGDEWQIFLVEDKEEKPSAIVLPSSAREGVISPTTEIWLTTLFAALTAITTINSAGVPLLQFLVEPFLTSITTQVCNRCEQQVQLCSA